MIVTTKEKTYFMRNRIILSGSVLLFFLLCAATKAIGQDYVSPTKPAETGKSPGVKVKLISTNGQTKNYVLIFSPGDEAVSGLTEFA